LSGHAFIFCANGFFHSGLTVFSRILTTSNSNKTKLLVTTTTTWNISNKSTTTAAWCMYTQIFNTYVCTIQMLRKVNKCMYCHVGVAQGTSHPTQKQKTRVRIPGRHSNSVVYDRLNRRCLCVGKDN
jgi:hypothetical protein